MFLTHRGPEGGISPECQMHGDLGEIENQSWSRLFNINQQAGIEVLTLLLVVFADLTYIDNKHN